MPGRPRTMFKRVSKIEKLAEELAGALERTIPEQYLAEPKPDDRLGRLWFRAYDAVLGAQFAIEHLNLHLGIRAGVYSQETGTPPGRHRRRRNSTRRNDSDGAARVRARRRQNLVGSSGLERGFRRGGAMAAAQ